MAKKRPDLTPTDVPWKFRNSEQFIQWCEIVIGAAFRTGEEAAKRRMPQKGVGGK